MNTFPDYDEKELKESPEKQKEVIQEIFDVLERTGNCRYVYHRLFVALTGNRNFYTDSD